MKKNIRIIISGGGTGGHIFPAVSIANAIKEQHPEAEILFVGAEGRMEMQRVPAAGYQIIGLPVAGFDRKHLLKNISVLIKLMKSQIKARRIIKEFKPDAAVGVGGYASGPTLKVAGSMGIPTLIQEQQIPMQELPINYWPKKHARSVLLTKAWNVSLTRKKFILTGNPVRQNLLNQQMSREDAIRSFNLDPTKKTVLIVGGSLGARTINNCVLNGLDQIRQSGVQFIWQTGKFYINEAKEKVGQAENYPMLHTTDFITDMAAAYSAADLVISRAGAGSISEFCLLGKPVILVPSPNVAEDHQTKNALALVAKDAALYIKDAEASEKLLKTAIETVQQPETLKKLSTNIAKLAFKDSANTIAEEVWKLALKYRENHEH